METAERQAVRRDKTGTNVISTELQRTNVAHARRVSRDLYKSAEMRSPQGRNRVTKL